MVSNRRPSIAIWVVLALSVAGYAVVDRVIRQESERSAPRKVELKQRLPNPLQAAKKKWSKKVGRVVELNTNKGRIEFVLFEADCPRTTKRIADLVSNGAYDGVRFTRVEKNSLVQTELAPRKVKPIDVEVCDGLKHVKGSVGMARAERYISNTSSFYITLKPQPTLDLEYTNFGRVIRGMDVAMRIREKDVIRSARLRPLTRADRDRFHELLAVESEQRVD